MGIREGRPLTLSAPK